MEIAKACYSVSKLRAAADMVKAINWSVKRKMNTSQNIQRLRKFTSMQAII